MNTSAQLFRKQGVENTSMRAIAEAIEYSPGTIYLHFSDKNELLYEVSVRAFDLFFRNLSPVKEIPDPLERLKQLGEAYITFGVQYPSYYALMFIMDEPMRCLEDSDWKEGYRNHKILTDIIRDCREEGHFRGYDLDRLSLMIWAEVHGIVSLHIRDRLNMYGENDRKQLLMDALHIFNDALENL